MTDPIELRHQGVATLDDRDRFAVVWLPAPFVPRAAPPDGYPPHGRALVPGGWYLIGHTKFLGDARENALTA